MVTRHGLFIILLAAAMHLFLVGDAAVWLMNRDPFYFTDPWYAAVFWSRFSLAGPVNLLALIMALLGVHTSTDPLRIIRRSVAVLGITGTLIGAIAFCWVWHTGSHRPIDARVARALIVGSGEGACVLVAIFVYWIAMRASSLWHAGLGYDPRFGLRLARSVFLAIAIEAILANPEYITLFQSWAVCLSLFGDAFAWSPAGLQGIDAVRFLLWRVTYLALLIGPAFFSGRSLRHQAAIFAGLAILYFSVFAFDVVLETFLDARSAVVTVLWSIGPVTLLSVATWYNWALIRLLLTGHVDFEVGFCPACGYSLTGLRSSRCPECGYCLPRRRRSSTRGKTTTDNRMGQPPII